MPNQIQNPKSKKSTKPKPKGKKSSKYLYAVGRRKTSIAQVRLFTDKGGDLLVNEKPYREYFPTLNLQKNLALPLKLTKTLNKFNIRVLVKGGGVRGQAEAVRLGIARTLVLYDKNLKKSLRDAGLLTRDSRKKERKKPGLKKARRAPQWQKR